MSRLCLFIALCFYYLITFHVSESLHQLRQIRFHLVQREAALEARGYFALVVQEEYPRFALQAPLGHRRDVGEENAIVAGVLAVVRLDGQCMPVVLYGVGRF
ncbi:MAG: hypothetical protein QOH93_2010, partial [Chloroflexia bacterium]|nr:hypothetical protein [Chloroflexia bacterium]